MVIDATTALVRPFTNLDLKYPVYLDDLRQEFPRVSFGPVQTEESLVKYGYYPVYPVDLPQRDVVEETIPVKRNGKYYRSYNTRDYTADELVAVLRAAKDKAIHAINAQFDAIDKRIIDITVGNTTYTMGLAKPIRDGIFETYQYSLLNPTIDAFVIRDANGDYHTVTASDILGIYKGILDYRVRLHNGVAKTIAAIEAATSIKAIPDIKPLP